MASAPMKSFQAKTQSSHLFLLCFYVAKVSNENLCPTAEWGGVFVIPEGLQTQPSTGKSHRTRATKMRTTPNRNPTVFATFAGGPGGKVITSFQDGVPDAKSSLEQMCCLFCSPGSGKSLEQQGWDVGITQKKQHCNKTWATIKQCLQPKWMMRPSFNIKPPPLPRCKGRTPLPLSESAK